jgi:hypothetical protein
MDAFGLEGVPRSKRFTLHGHDKIDWLADGPFFIIPSMRPLQVILRASGMYFSRPQNSCFCDTASSERKGKNDAEAM